MGILNKVDILLLLDTLAHEVVVDTTTEFPFKIVRHYSGYSNNPVIGALQAKLSIMLAAADIAEGNKGTK